MRPLETCRIALANLVGNKLRALLTILGIIIGVGAVIALLTLGRAVQQVIAGELEGLGSNLIFLFAGTNNPAINREVPPVLTNEDIEAISRPLNAPAVAAIAAEFSRRATVTYQATSYDSLVSGVTPNYASVRSAGVDLGRFFDERALHLRSRVAVLGSRVRGTLFPGQGSPIGRRIRINGISFVVVGVMVERGGTFASNEDDQIFIPISTAQERLFASALGAVQKVEVSVAYIQARDKEHIDAAIDQVTRLLRQRHRLTYQDNNFTLVTQEDLVTSFGIITGAITAFLGAIAAISLLVGGIGIMNIMLVSVTERTREIGLRKAVGARRRDILVQFLVEATVLSLLGGLLGVLLGYGMAAIGTVILSRFSSNAHATVQLDSVLLATLTSIGVGMFFGLYPAIRAARLSPIDALRYE